jgi:hypothetical protein
MGEKGLFLRDMLSQNIDETIKLKTTTGELITGVIMACFNDCLLIQKPKSRGKPQATYVMLSKIVWCFRVEK